MSRLPRTGPTSLQQRSAANEARLRGIHRALGNDVGDAARRPAVNGGGYAKVTDAVDQVTSAKRPPDLVSIIERKRGAWSAAALAELLECSEKHIYALARSGRMPHLRIDGMIRFDPCITAEWLRKYIVAA